ncbi:hypothetical protein BaRGS_00016719, partial [Batillaria attramentaria]
VEMTNPQGHRLRELRELICLRTRRSTGNIPCGFQTDPVYWEGWRGDGISCGEECDASDALGMKIVTRPDASFERTVPTELHHVGLGSCGWEDDAIPLYLRVIVAGNFTPPCRRVVRARHSDPPTPSESVIIPGTRWVNLGLDGGERVNSRGS